ncbi:MAG: hypothetical protein WC804_11930 [Sphingomonas sp.]|jgi:hypothetical protein|uniref:hypothetical protein n=1 Tax=Sphingomonas sp. TaxID=28214 RepID=UPI00356B5D27
MAIRECATLAALMVLSGCATFDGRATQVITVKQADMLIAGYRPDLTIEALGHIDPTDTAGRNTYRNRVIAAYLTTIDAHYGQFVREISRSGKGVHLGVDTSLLLLTGAGAIFHKAASGLSAGATAVAGVRGSFDRELLADKTLPILVSLMDSRRLAVRAEIVRGQSKPEGVYTLEDAYADLMRYEAAGTIDGALSDAATGAGAQARENQYDFSKAKDLCVVSAAVDAKRRALMLSLEQFERDAENAVDPKVAAQKRALIQTSAQSLGIAAASAPADKAAAFGLLAAIRDQVETQCSDAGVDALSGKITAAGVTL